MIDYWYVRNDADAHPERCLWVGSGGGVDMEGVVVILPCTIACTILKATEKHTVNQVS